MSWMRASFVLGFLPYQAYRAEENLRNKLETARVYKYYTMYFDSNFWLSDDVSYFLNDMYMDLVHIQVRKELLGKLLKIKLSDSKDCLKFSNKREQHAW